MVGPTFPRDDSFSVDTYLIWTEPSYFVREGKEERRTKYEVLEDGTEPLPPAKEVGYHRGWSLLRGMDKDSPSFAKKGSPPATRRARPSTPGPW